MLDRRKVELGRVADGTEFPAEMTISAFRDGTAVDLSRLHRGHLRAQARARSERAGWWMSCGGPARQRATLWRVVGALSDAVTIRDRHHRFVYANAAALPTSASTPWRTCRRPRPPRSWPTTSSRTETGDAVAMDDIPSVRILRGEPAEPLLIRTVHRQTGEQYWNLLKAAPLLDEAGEIEATIMMIEDVTEQKRAERQGVFLAQVSAVLASSLDYEQTLRNIAQLAVPDIADWCAVDLVDEDGDRRPVAVAHTDPGDDSLAEQLRQYEPSGLNPERGLGRVFRTGQPVLYPQIPDEMLVRPPSMTRHLDLLRAVGMRSAAIVPMRDRQPEPGRDDARQRRVRPDARPLRSRARRAGRGRAAVAIENARLYSERSLIAHTLQQSLLPEQLPQLPGYELASVYIPAFESTEVGGTSTTSGESQDGWMIDHRRRHREGRAGGRADLAGAPHDADGLGVRIQPRRAAGAGRQHAPRSSRAARSARRCVCGSRTRATLAAGGHPLPVAVSPRRRDRVGETARCSGGFPNASWEDSTVDSSPTASSSRTPTGSRTRSARTGPATGCSGCTIPSRSSGDARRLR